MLHYFCVCLFLSCHGQHHRPFLSPFWMTETATPLRLRGRCSQSLYSSPVCFSILEFQYILVCSHFFFPSFQLGSASAKPICNYYVLLGIFSAFESLCWWQEWTCGLGIKMVAQHVILSCSHASVLELFLKTRRSPIRLWLCLVSFIGCSFLHRLHVQCFTFLLPSWWQVCVLSWSSRNLPAIVVILDKYVLFLMSHRALEVYDDSWLCTIVLYSRADFLLKLSLAISTNMCHSLLRFPLMALFSISYFPVSSLLNGGAHIALRGKRSRFSTKDISCELDLSVFDGISRL